MARPLALAAAVAVSLLAVAGAGGAATQQIPKRGGTLVVGTRTASEPECLNPIACEGTAGAVAGLVRQVLPGAFEVLPDGTLRPELADAEIVAARPFTVVYRIRMGARWSDGTPVSARDFVFTQPPAC